MINKILKAYRIYKMNKLNNQDKIFYNKIKNCNKKIKVINKIIANKMSKMSIVCKIKNLFYKIK